jgi:hypothetical protein
MKTAIFIRPVAVEMRGGNFAGGSPSVGIAQHDLWGDCKAGIFAERSAKIKPALQANPIKMRWRQPFLSCTLPVAGSAIGFSEHQLDPNQREINAMKKIFQLLPGALLFSAVLLGLACNKLNAVANQSNAAGASTTAPAASPTVSDNPEDKMPRVKVQDAMKEVADGTAVIIDVRGTDAYKMAHIKGALDTPLTKLEGKDFNGIPKDKRIIAYCT